MNIHLTIVSFNLLSNLFKCVVQSPLEKPVKVKDPNLGLKNELAKCLWNKLSAFFSFVVIIRVILIVRVIILLVLDIVQIYSKIFKDLVNCFTFNLANFNRKITFMISTIGQVKLFLELK